jgi:hypothetical protein
MHAREVLAPHVEKDVDSPELWVIWLEATRRLSTREGAPWHAAPADVADAEMRARKSLANHPDHLRLQELLEQKTP